MYTTASFQDTVKRTFSIPVASIYFISFETLKLESIKNFENSFSIVEIPLNQEHCMSLLF